MDPLSAEELERLEPPFRRLKKSVRFLVVGYDGFISTGAFLLLVLGCVFIFHFGTSYTLKDYTKFHTNVEEVAGKVKSVVPDWFTYSSGSSTSVTSTKSKVWTVEFEYEWKGELKRGTSYAKTRSSGGSDPPAPLEEGEKVRVEVQSLSPEIARIKGLSIGKNIGFRTLIALLVFVAAGLCFSASRKSRRVRLRLLQEGLVSQAFLSEDSEGSKAELAASGVELNPEMQKAYKRLEFKTERGMTQEFSEVISCDHSLRVLQAGGSLPILYLPFRPECYFVPALEDDFPFKVDSGGEWAPQNDRLVIKSALLWFLLGACWIFVVYRVFFT